MRTRLLVASAVAVTLAGLAGAGAASSRTAVSANGLLAFTRDGAIYTAKADGSSLQAQSSPPAGAVDGAPGWSADGRRLAWVRDCSLGTSDCTEGAYVSTGAGNEQLYDRDVPKETSRLAWAPDGGGLMVSALGGITFTEQIPAPTGHGCSANLNLHIDGGGADAAWAANGRIAFIRNGVVAVDTIVLGQTANPFEPCNGPDVTDAQAPLCPDYSHYGCAHALLLGATSVDWSPDGARLVVTNGDATSGQGVWVVNADGSGLTRIVSASTASGARWSPDGSLIAFVQRDGDFTDVWTVRPDGTDLQLAIPNADHPAWQPRAAFPQCSTAAYHAPTFPYDPAERAQVHADEAAVLYHYRLDLVTVVNNLVADARRHPAHKAADLKQYTRLKKLLAVVRSGASAGEQPVPPNQLTQAEKDFVAQSGCGLFDDAIASLHSYIQDHGDHIANADAADELVTRFGQLGDVLDGNVDRSSDQAKEILKANVIDLVGKFAGSNVRDYLRNGDQLVGKGLEIERVLSGQLDRDQLDAALEKNVTQLAEKIAGSDGAALAKDLLTLRKVIAGTATPEEQFTAVKVGLLDLASRLVGRNIMDVPQVRAAMLGFEIGRALGNSMAANLKIVAKASLVRACRSGIFRQQRHDGVDVEGPDGIHYDVETRVTLTQEDVIGNTEWLQSECDTEPDSVVSGYPNGIIKVILPTHFWGISFLPRNGWTTIYLDPTFAP